MFGLLAVAGTLTPSESGKGTHQQLGLPPCTFEVWFRLPCPTCGMTTSWCHLMNGNVAESWSANPGGTCLAVLSALAGIWLLVSAVRGRQLLAVPANAISAAVYSVAAITLMDWFRRVL